MRLMASSVPILTETSEIMVLAFVPNERSPQIQQDTRQRLCTGGELLLFSHSLSLYFSTGLQGLCQDMNP